MFKLDPGSVVSLFQELRKKFSLLQNRTERGSEVAVAVLGVEENAMEPEVCCVWAMLEVLICQIDMT